MDFFFRRLDNLHRFFVHRRMRKDYGLISINKLNKIRAKVGIKLQSFKEEIVNGTDSNKFHWCLNCCFSGQKYYIYGKYNFFYKVLS